MELIDKAAIVAEIEKCYNECLKRAKIARIIDSNYWNTKAEAYRNVLVILDNTLEVKEVDLEKEIDDYINEHFSECEDGVLISDANSKELTLLDVMPMARHFYELGLKKGE